MYSHTTTHTHLYTQNHTHAVLKALNSCSINFPVINYIISIASQSVTVPALTATTVGDRITVSLSQSNITSLTSDAMHSVSVTACSEVSCSESKTKPFCKSLSFMCSSADYDFIVIIMFESVLLLGYCISDAILKNF